MMGYEKLQVNLPFYMDFKCNAPSRFPSFNIHVIDTTGSQLGQTDLANIDVDGDLDWIVGEAPWSN